MKIILAEVTSGKNSSELAFDKGSVLIGRDASVCDIVFDGATFPMVSRRHAELAWAGGSWTIRDLGSSYGTYVDGRRVHESAVINAGSRIQVGAEGPVVVGFWFEVGSEAVAV